MPSVSAVREAGRIRILGPFGARDDEGRTCQRGVRYAVHFERHGVGGVGPEPLRGPAGSSRHNADQQGPDAGTSQSPSHAQANALDSSLSAVTCDRSSNRSWAETPCLPMGGSAGRKTPSPAPAQAQHGLLYSDTSLSELSDSTSPEVPAIAMPSMYSPPFEHVVQPDPERLG